MQITAFTSVMLFSMLRCNSVTFFQASTVPGKMSTGTYLPRGEVVTNGQTCNKPHLLANRIYPKSPLFFYSIISPSSDEDFLYAVRPEGQQKDIEQAFVVF